MTYLEDSRVAITEQEVLNVETLDEKKVLKTIDDTLESLYPALMTNWLRKLDLEQLTKVMYDVVGTFNESISPKEELSKELVQVKNIIIKAIEDVAKSDTKSIKDNAFRYFKFNPTSKIGDVEDYVRTIMIQSKKNIK